MDIERIRDISASQTESENEGSDENDGTTAEMRAKIKRNNKASAMTKNW